MSRRVVMCLSLLISVSVLVGLGVSLGGSVSAFHGLSWMTSQSEGTPTPAPTPLPIASRVQAFYQGDRTAGWDNSQQYDTWWPSACSPAALTMAMRAWGMPVGIGEVLDRLI